VKLFCHWLTLWSWRVGHNPPNELREYACGLITALIRTHCVLF
jgi:hypothetical protein